MLLSGVLSVLIIVGDINSFPLVSDVRLQVEDSIVMALIQLTLVYDHAALVYI